MSSGTALLHLVKAQDNLCFYWEKRLMQTISPRAMILAATLIPKISAADGDAKTIMQIIAKEIDKLYKILEPFAAAANDLDDQTENRSEIWELPAAMGITAGDLRKVRELMENP